MNKSMSLRTLIVDDEEAGRKTLQNLLQEYCPEVQVLGQAQSVAEAIAQIEALQPELVLLDVELRPGSGFDVLKHFHPAPFQVIFCTAFDHYAIRAFEFAAVHYLRKPVDILDLQEAVRRCRKPSSDISEQIGLLINGFRKREIGKVALPTMEGFSFVEVEQIVNLVGEGSYTRFFLLSGEDLLVSRRIGHYEDLFAQDLFFRVHQSHLINLRHITRFVNTKNGRVALSHGREVPVARNRKKDLLDQLRNLGML